jgi:DNA invertase Pin-like site-specific DNA recombinase
MREYRPKIRTLIHNMKRSPQRDVNVFLTTNSVEAVLNGQGCLEGDTLVVWKLDRIGRSVKNPVDLTTNLHRQGVQFRSLTDAIDTGTPSGRFFFHVMASLAEMERELTVERTRAGLELARRLGRRGGRRRAMTDSKIESARKLLANGVPPKEVAHNLGVSVPTLYRWLPASERAG